MNAIATRRSPELIFRDDDRTVVIIASGPSAGGAPLELCAGFPVIVVNDAWRLYPNADALYAADRNWWVSHIDEVRKSFTGERWTTDRQAAVTYNLWQIDGRHEAGLCTKPDVIFFNKNSGAQAINLAFHAGARRMVLIGFDMRMIKGELHFFGRHPDQLRNSPELYPIFIRDMAVLARDLATQGVEVINTSHRSALPYWPKADLAEALRCRALTA